MAIQSSQMRREILEIPAAVDRLLTMGETEILKAADAIRKMDPVFAVTVARGSSDHACTYLKYAMELLLGVPVASVGPSVASIYKAPLRMKNGLCISVSQSGKSPDIVEMARAARRDGASVGCNNKPCRFANCRGRVIHAGHARRTRAQRCRNQDFCHIRRGRPYAFGEMASGSGSCAGVAQLATVSGKGHSL